MKMKRSSLLLLALAAAVVVAVAARQTPKKTVKRQTARVSWPPAGVAGVDYPTYNEVPDNLQFNCNDKLAGYYADVEAQCQVWHWCLPGGQRYSFLCPNQTMFNQNYRVCDWWYNVKCEDSVSLYAINDDLYKDDSGNPL